MQINSILPIIVPRIYFQHGNWQAFYKFLRHPDLAVTWVDISAPDTMLYLNIEAHQALEAAGHDVHELAMRNLRAAGPPTTHDKTVDGSVVFRAMMHGDGLGTSRLLLLPELRNIFPQGYVAGIPERSCGIVAPKGLTEEDHNSVLQMVNGCYEAGTTPM